MTRKQLHFTQRQVNLLLEVLIVAAIASGLVSWVVPLSSARPVMVVHAASGFLIMIIAPLKVRGPVKSGLKRGRPTRWVSIAFGILVLSTIALGVSHASGIWFGVGFWSALWTHQLFGFLIVPLLAWHVVSRPVRPTLTDIDRRGFLTGAFTSLVALGVILGQEVLLEATGLPGADRDGTGSIETGSFDPSRMPTVMWLNDTAPADTTIPNWPLVVAGHRWSVDEVRAKGEEVTARLDCTGGWYADQRWDAVPIADLLPIDAEGRSIKVTSETGYSRLFPLAAADEIYLATGYDGVPLRRGHGAPVRVVAPGRRGPQWIKWVVDVRVSDRPAWLQLPLPPT